MDSPEKLAKAKLKADYNRRWRKANQEKVKSYPRWSKSHPEEHATKARAWEAANKERAQERRRAYYKKNAEALKAQSMAWRRAHPKAATAYYKKWRDETLVKKAGRPRPSKCEICGRGGVICFDHCHVTEKFRGWLCRKCNNALGMVDD